MKEKKAINKQLIIGIVLAIMCVVCLCVGLYGPVKNKIAKATGTDTTVPYSDSTQAPLTKADGTPVTGIDTPQAQSELRQLDEYRDITTDVYAMIRIPGTNIDYPVAQSQTDDKHYIRHDVNGKFSPGGTLFTEHAYNSLDFSDRVTIIYGHNMSDGEMFGNIQEYYTDENTFNTFKDIYIVVDGRELHYKVFAAAPYSDVHLMYKYKKFGTEQNVSDFLDTIYNSRDFGVNVDEANKADGSDRLLILSTCLKGNYSKRYLVIARQV